MAADPTPEERTDEVLRQWCDHMTPEEWRELQADQPRLSVLRAALLSEIRSAVEAEREAICELAMKIAKKWWDRWPNEPGVCRNCGDAASEVDDAIRARGKEAPRG